MLGTAPNYRKQPERRDELGEKYGPPVPRVVRKEYGGFAKHEIRYDRAANGTPNLRREVGGHVAPGQPALKGVG